MKRFTLPRAAPPRQRRRRRTGQREHGAARLRHRHEVKHDDAAAVKNSAATVAAQDATGRPAGYRCRFMISRSPEPLDLPELMRQYPPFRTDAKIARWLHALNAPLVTPVMKGFVA